MNTVKIILCSVMLTITGQSYAGTEGLSRQVQALNAAMASYRAAVDQRVNVLTADLNTVNADLAAYKAANDAAVSVLGEQLSEAKVCGNAGKLYAPDSDSANSDGCLSVSSGGGGGGVCQPGYYMHSNGRCERVTFGK